MTLRDLVAKLYHRSDVPYGEVALNCPFCRELVGKDDTKSRFGLNVATGVGHCFRCEKKHSAKGGRKYWFYELCRVFKVNYVIDDKEKDTDEKVQSFATSKTAQKLASVSLPQEYEPLWKNVDEKIGKRAKKYLINRGITPLQIKKHRIGFCAVGKYAYRVIIPVYSEKGKLKAFVARDFSGKSTLRYLNSEGAKSLFNLPKEKARAVILAEGIFDVLAIENTQPYIRGYVDAVAALGKSLTLKQVKTLSKYKQVIIWPDPDRPGVEGAIKRAYALQKRKVKVSVVLPDPDIELDTDLGDMKPYEIFDRFKQRKEFSPTVAAIMRNRIASVAPPKRKKTFLKRPSTNCVQ